MFFRTNIEYQMRSVGGQTTAGFNRKSSRYLSRDGDVHLCARTSRANEMTQ